MPLPLTVSCFSKIQIVVFCYWLTRVVPEKKPLNGCVCVYWVLYIMFFYCLSVFVHFQAETFCDWLAVDF